MTDTTQKLAAHVEAGEADLERLLRARDRREIARLMRRLRCWHRELLLLAEVYDPIMVAYLRILDPKPEEVQRIRRWYADLHPFQQGLCNAIQASLVRVKSDLMR